MGKKLRGAALRAKKRAQGALEELQERQADQHVADTFSAKDNAELFVIDTHGTSNKAIVAAAAAASANSNTTKPKKRRMELSAKDKAQVERLLQTHTTEQLKAMAARGQQDSRVGPPRRKRLAASDTQSAGFDLWNSAEEQEAATAAAEAMRLKQELPTPGIGFMLAGLKPAHETTKAKKMPDSLHKPPTVAVDVAKAGQSYRPDPVAHKKLMRQAAQLEVARDETLDELARPLAQGMSAETRALLMEDSSDYDSDSDEEGEQGDDADKTGSTAVGPIPRREDKLTRAQRNKQKRLRQEKTALGLAKRQKQLEKQVGELPKYKKELKKRKHDDDTKIKPEYPDRVLGKDVAMAAVQQDPQRAPTVAVALTTPDSLRSLQPKGSLVQERLASLQDRNLAPKPTHKHPHKRRRKLNVKGTRNSEANGGDIVVMG